VHFSGTLTVKCFPALAKKSLQLDQNYTKMENAYVVGESFTAFSIFLCTDIMIESE